MQAYRNNRKLVIALNPLPHSGSQTSGETACEICKRILMDPRSNRYCSIACKVAAFMKKTNNAEPPFLALRSPSPPPPPPPSRSPSPDRNPNSKRPRKGVPHRAPVS
ncbi:hypothetical protein RHSIM_Rhsim10G0181000 [Rhododendron simsii]|uniref:PLATZ transcription factor family protein n=1 Tax=Rhododendron simsii TaxID=118357 RepID=A0A834GA78_RHOSS|nr:hypothetical protein RHSIM_Rhsim10G0181000 [Rhododendron simsii]